jgi:Patatin-like phospholipase
MRNEHRRTDCNHARKARNGTFHPSTSHIYDSLLTRVQTVDDAIAKYSTLSETVFTTTSNAITAKFDHVALENTLKKVIAESPLTLQHDALLPDTTTCKTFVVAIRTRGGGAAAQRLRTYDTNTADAFSAPIWEAARATSAAPTFFQPITINGIKYGDGGTGWNNPTAEAIAEAGSIWPNRPIGCLLSLGTGLEEAIQLGDGNDQLSQGFSRSLLQKLAPQVSFQLQVAKYCVASLTGCEKTHRDVSEKWPERVFPNVNYFRFNVPQGMSQIGLEEWKKIGDIVALTEDYMEHGENLDRKKTVARVLLNPQLAS